MGIKQGLLSDLQLRRWLKDGEPLAKSGGDGLTFTVSAAGRAAWVLRYRNGSRRFELTLGRYPDITLAEAQTMWEAADQCERLQGDHHHCVDRSAAARPQAPHADAG